MNVTESRFKNRQLHIEDYLQMVSAEQREYAEVFDYSKITEKSGVITDYWTNNLLELILRKENLNKAYKQVKSNKGSGEIDGMQVDELLPYLRENQETLIQKIRDGKYKPNSVRRVEIPKKTKGEFRKPGVPTVVDRVIQQAITQELTPIYEEQFSENSFGFRPNRGAHDALRQCQKNVNDGYVYVVDMDLEKFFDTVCQSKLIKLAKKELRGWKVIMICIMSSLFIEMIQLFTNIITRYPTHVCDIDDLILNSIGAIIGYVIIIILNKIAIINKLIESIVYKKQ